MSEQALAKVFDPFFTTKPEGLGLGLTISKRILESYQGSLSAYNHSAFSDIDTVSYTHLRAHET